MPLLRALHPDDDDLDEFDDDLDEDEFDDEDEDDEEDDEGEDEGYRLVETGHCRRSGLAARSQHPPIAGGC